MTTATAEQASVAAREQVRSTVPPILPPSGRLGIQLTTMEDYWRFAKCVLDGQWAPKNMNQSAIVIAMQFGAELGIDPVQAIQNIAVINGRPTVWGDMLLGLCMRKSSLFDHGVFEEGFEGEGDKLEAYCVVGRIGGNPRRETFSVADAKRAKLWDKDTYRSYPKRMLQMRARAFALRNTFPDVTKGLYSREEMAVDEVLGNLDLTGEAPREPFNASKVTKKPEPTAEPDTVTLPDPRGGTLVVDVEGAPGTQAETPDPDPTPPPAEPKPDVCPECGGRRHGRGYQHADRCSKSRAAAPAPPSEPEPPPPADDPADPVAMGVLRRGLIGAFDQLDVPDQEQLKHQWGMAESGKAWPNIGACYGVNDPAKLRRMYEQVRARLAKASSPVPPDGAPGAH